MITTTTGSPQDREKASGAMRIVSGVAGLLAVALLAAGCGQGEPSSGQSAPATVDVLHAGMVTSLVTTGIPEATGGGDAVKVQASKGNSVKLAREIKAREKTGDLYFSADASVNQTLMGASNGDWVRWFLVFARNEVVLAYGEQGRFAAELEKAAQNKLPWYQILQRDGFRLGRDDPDADPLGYYALFVAELAERSYGIPGLRKELLGADDNPEQVLSTSADLLLENKLDAQFMYLNRAEEGGVPYVRLPDAINLSDPERNDSYRAASFTNSDGQTFRGSAIQVSVAPLRGARHAEAAQQVLRLLMSDAGKDLLRRYDYVPSKLLVGGDRSAVPAALRPLIEGAY